jgi:hypothetical protein
MPCWPDLWEHIRRALPSLGILALLLAYVGLIVLLLWAPRIRKLWLRILSRILGIVAATPLVVAIPALFLALMLALGDPPAKIRQVVSTDGQIATLKYNAGFLGRDSTEIILKQSDCCHHAVVFRHHGPSSFEDTKIKWIDNSHLEITYHTRPDDQRQCVDHINKTQIVCIALQFAKE